MENRTNDWVATLLYNGDLAMNELSQVGITPDNTSLQTKDYYKKMDAVQSAPEFCDENGTFQEAKFNAFYDNALNAFNQFTNDDYTKNLIANYQFGRDAWFAPIESSILDTTPRYTLNKEAANVSEGIRRLYQFGQGPQALSVRELAQTQHAVDSVTGRDLGYSPNEKGGFTAIFNRPTLVLAQYDTEGYHDENGVQVHHNAGDLKYNAAGKPFYETLGNRDIYGKDVLRFTDTLTVDGSTWNKYDFFDSDGIDKSVGKTIAHTVAQVAPMFIPYVGTAYGIITAAQALNRLMPVLGKTFNGVVTGTNDNELGRKLSKWEGFAAQFDQTQSDYSREHVLSVENLGNMVGAVSAQLFQQRVISQIPQFLNKSEIFNVNPELGKTLALAYMAGTSSQEAYQDFKQAGASDRVAGFAMIANMAALYKLMNIDYFRDTLFKGSFMDESVTRDPARGVAQMVNRNMLEAAEHGSEKEAVGFINTLTRFYHNRLVPGLTKSEFINRSISEGVEEVMEEATSDAIKGFTSAFNALGVPVTEPKKELDFGFSAKDILTRYGMSFGGGVIGGAVFYGHGKWENWLHDQAMRQKYGDAAVDNLKQDDLQKLVYLVANGKAGEIRDYYRRWHAQGILGNKNLGSSNVEVDTIEGHKLVSDSVGDGMNQNDAVYAVLTNMIDNIENVVNSEKMNYSEADLKRVIQLGWNPADKNMLRADALVNIGSYSNFNNDIYKTISDIVKTRSELNNRINQIAGNPTTEEQKKTADEALKNDKVVNDLKNKLKDLRQKRDDMMAGKYNKYYSGQGFFAANTPLNSLFTGLTVENFARVKYNKVYELLDSEQKAEIDKEYEEYKNTESKKDIYQAYDLYLSIAERWGASLAERLKQNPTIDQSTHEMTTGYQNYVQLSHDVELIENQIKELQAKETLSKTELKKLADLQGELTNKRQELIVMANNPGTLTDLLLHKDSEFTKLINSDIFDSDYGIQQLGKLVEGLYTDSLNKGTIVESDGEYRGLLNVVKSQYMRSHTFDDSFTGSLSDALMDLFVQEGMTQPDPDSGEPMLTSEAFARVHNLFASQYSLSDDGGENSELLNKIYSTVQEMISAFGVNNNLVVKKYNELMQLLQSSGLNPEEISTIMEYLVPRIGTEFAPDYISRIDAIRAKAPKSIASELLKEFCAVFNQEAIPIIDLIENEMNNLANATNIGEYLIQNQEILKALNLQETLMPLLRAAAGVIRGGSDGTNQTINGYSGGEIENLIELTPEQTHLLTTELDILENRIKAFISVHEANKNQSLRIQKDIAINMRPKFIKALIAETKDGVTGINEKINTEFGINLNEIWDQLACPVLLSDVTEQNFKEIEPYIIKFEQAVFDAFSQFGDKVELANKLVKVFGKTLYLKTSTSLSASDEVEISPYDTLLYLASLTAIPSQSFYIKYRDKISSDDFKFAPIYAQEFAVKLSVANIAAPELFNNILNALHDKNNIELPSEITDEASKNYIYDKSPLFNFIVTLGGAGTGKSTGYASTVIKMLDDVDKEIVYLAPNNTTQNPQADNLKNNVGVDGIAFGKADFFSTAFEYDVVTKYKTNNRNGHLTPEKVISEAKLKKDKIFKSTNKLKILLIDEISCFTEYELKALSKWACNNNIKIIALGDVKQDQADVIKTNGSHATSGLEDCDYIKSPFLTASLRSANLAKFENYTNLNRILTEIENIYEANPQYDRAMLASKLKDLITDSRLEVNYYEDDSVLYGDRIVNMEDDRHTVINEIQKLLGLGGSIAIITDDSIKSKYAGFTNNNNIQFVSPAKLSQGGEWDYIIVDTDFEANNNANAYLIAKNLYTISQRSRMGSVIVDNNLRKNLTINNDNTPRLNQKFEKADDSNIAEFKKWRLEALSGLENPSEQLGDYLQNQLAIQNEPGSSSAQSDDGIPPATGTTGSTAGTSSSTAPAASGSAPTAGSGTVNPTAGTSGSVSAGISAGSAQETTTGGVSGVSGITVGTQPIPPQDGAAGETNPPVPPVSAESATSVIMSNQTFFNYLDSSDFDRDDRADHNSLRNVITINNPNTYKTTVEFLASIVRCGYTGRRYNSKNNTALRSILGNETNAADLFDYIKTEPEIWVMPYTNNMARIIARFKLSDNEFFDVPVGLTGTLKYGKIKSKNPFKLTKIPFLKKGSERITLSEFKKRHPHVYTSQFGGVLMASEEIVNDATNISDETREFLLRTNKRVVNGQVVEDKTNNGKAMVFVTSEIAKRLSDLTSSNQNKVWNVKDGYSHSLQNSATLMGTQQILSMQQVMDWVKILSNYSDAQVAILDAKTISSVPEVLKGYDWNEIASNPEAKAKLNKMRELQVLTYGQTYRLISIAWQTFLNKDMEAYNDMLTNLQLFINTSFRTYSRKNHDRVESHTGLYLGGYYVTTQNGKLMRYPTRNETDVVVNYDNGVETSFETMFNDCNWEPGQRLLFGKTLNITTQDNQTKIETYRYKQNDMLYVLFGGLNEESLSLIEQDPQYKHSIYVQDVGGKIPQGSQFWKTLDVNDDVYYTDIETVYVDVYELNINDIDTSVDLNSGMEIAPTAPETNPEPQKPTLSEFVHSQPSLNKFMAGLTSSISVNDFNNYIRQNSPEPNYPVVEETPDGFTVSQYNAVEHPEEWLLSKFKLKTGIDPSTVTIEVNDNHLSNSTWNCAIFSVYSQNDLSTKLSYLCRKIGDHYEIVSFGGTDPNNVEQMTSFAELMQIVQNETDPVRKAILNNYLLSTLFEGSDSNSVNEMINMWGDDQTVMEKIAIYLMNRLNNNEC